VIHKTFGAENLVKQKSDVMTGSPINVHQNRTSRTQDTVRLDQSRPNEISICSDIDEAIIKCQTLASLPAKSRIEWWIEINQINRGCLHIRKDV